MYQSFEVDMMLDPLIQQLEEATLFLEEVFKSLIHVLHSSLVEPDFSFLGEWHSTHDLEEAPFGIDMRILEHASQISYILRILPTHGRGFIDTPLVLFLSKGKNVVLHSLNRFYIKLGSFSIGVYSTLRAGYLVNLSLLLSYGGTFPHMISSPFSNYFILLNSLFGEGFFPCGFSSFSSLWEIALHLYFTLASCTWAPNMA